MINKKWIRHRPKARRYNKKVYYQRHKIGRKPRRRHYGSVLSRLSEQEIKREGWDVPSQKEMDKWARVLYNAKKEGIDPEKLIGKANTDYRLYGSADLTPKEDEIIDAHILFDTGKHFKRLAKKTIPTKELEFVDTVIVDKDAGFAVPVHNVTAFTNRGRVADERMLEPFKKDLNKALQEKGFKRIDETHLGNELFRGTTLQKWKIKPTEK